MTLVPVLKRDTSGGVPPATNEQTAKTPAEKKSGDMEGMPGMSGGVRGAAHAQTAAVSVGN